MTKCLRRIALMLITILTVIATSQSQKWTIANEQDINVNREARQIIPEVYTTYSIDIDALRVQLLDEARESERALIALPIGEQIKEFVLFRADVFHPLLAAKYPSIQAYTGYNVENPSQVVKLSMSHLGMDAMFLGGGEPVSYIDAYAKNNESYYISYNKSDYLKSDSHEFHCKVEQPNDGYKPPASSPRYGDCALRTYRLALACTGEYAAFHGGTVESVLAAYNTAMNRVNGIYERDAAITMQIIADTDMLIFFDSATDPYDNDDGGSMLTQNQNTVDQTIGSANYDIGHVFSTGGGGIASLRSPCNNNRKARGVTGLGSPVNDGFYVDYVAHEMGHQFGGNHCYNNSCSNNRNDGTAVEPGSGATIMAYAGICAPNIQNNSDDYFHTVNLEEIANFVVAGNGGCAVETALTNNPPSIESVGDDVTIPRGTPFLLTVTATDADDDMLTYTWEQMDTEIADMPPVSTSTGGPVFRSFDPSSSPTRYFPRLSNILNETNGSTWEVLPTVSREMNFRATVRDNATGGGCTDFDDVTVTVDGDSGSFEVTEPTNLTIWNSGGTGIVNWEVAGTDQAPISCETVDLILLTGTDRNFDVILASDVPNNGSFEVAVPSINTTTARIMVRCATNIFFDINAGDFAIVAPFSTVVDKNEVVICPEQSTMLNLSYIPNNDFAEETIFAVNNVPDGLTVVLDKTTVVDTSEIMVEISADGSIAPGEYEIEIEGNSATAISKDLIVVRVASAANQALSNKMPIDGSRGVSIAADLSWDDVDGNQGYMIQVSEDAGFANLLIDDISQTNSYSLTGLETSTVYYWRVAIISPCFDLAYLNDQAFQTEGLSCQSYENNDSITITEEDDNNIMSPIDIPDDINIGLINVGLKIDHTYVGDLTGSITSPTDVVVNLFDRAGVPASNFGCARDNMDVVFSSTATLSYEDFESTCDNELEAAISGEFQPLESIANYSGNSSLGLWTLGITDLYDPDGGVLVSWYVEVCQSTLIEAGTVVNNTGLQLTNVANAQIDMSNINVESGDDMATVYMIKESPQFGSIQKIDASQGGFVAIGKGDTFTQQDMTDGSLRYQFEGVDQTIDQVIFDIVDDQNRWVLDELFIINIDIGMLTASANITSSILCAGDSNGEVTLMGVGGLLPYVYSLDGVEFQDENTFAGLSGGTYTGYVRDDSGETEEVVFVMPNPTQIAATVDVQREVVTVNAEDGTGSLMYSIDGINFQSENVFSLSNITNYTVTIQDENGCSLAIDAEVNYVESYELLVTDVICNNEATGTISIETVVGGPEPYTYTIDPGTSQSEPLFLNLMSGVYSTEVQDANGVTVTEQVTVGQPSPYNVSVDTVGSTAEINVIGNTSPYTYQLDGGDVQEENLFVDLLSGIYTVTITDVNGCQTAVDFEIVNSTVSTDFISNDDIKIFPNPTTEKFTIVNDSRYLFDRIQIFDVAGMKVYDALYTSSVDVSHFVDGVFIIKLLNNEKVGTARFLKNTNNK